MVGDAGVELHVLPFLDCVMIPGGLEPGNSLQRPDARNELNEASHRSAPDG